MLTCGHCGKPRGTCPHPYAFPDTPTAPEPAAAPFCTRCDGYGVVLPVGSSIAATCPACNGNTADRPERGPKHEPAAAPRVDTAAVREIAALFDPPHPADAGLLYAAADELDTLREAGKVVVADADAAWAEVARQRTELDTHRSRHAELVALVAEWRTAPPSLALFRMAANTLARILGEQP